MNQEPQGLHRQNIYRYLESQGFEVTEERHKELRNLLKPIKEIEKVKVEEHLPREHVIICKDCNEKRIQSGHLSARFAYYLKRCEQEAKKLITPSQGTEE